MGKALVAWSQAQHKELQEARKHHPKPYVREKCAALLKVAAGRSCREVAWSGLNNVHAPDTLSDWIAAYQHQGLAGLVVGQGRGRKPAFSPCLPHSRAGKRATGGDDPSGSALV